MPPAWRSPVYTVKPHRADARRVTLRAGARTGAPVISRHPTRRSHRPCAACPRRAGRSAPGVQNEHGRGLLDAQGPHQLKAGFSVDLDVLDALDHVRHLGEDPPGGPAGLAERAGELHQAGPVPGFGAQFRRAEPRTVRSAGPRPTGLRPYLARSAPVLVPAHPCSRRHLPVRLHRTVVRRPGGPRSRIIEVRSYGDPSAPDTRRIPCVTRISPGTVVWAGQQPVFGARSPRAAYLRCRNFQPGAPPQAESGVSPHG